MFSHAQICKKQIWKAAYSITLHVMQWPVTVNALMLKSRTFLLKPLCHNFLVFSAPYLHSQDFIKVLQCSHLSYIFCHEHMAMNGCPHWRRIVWHVGKESEFGITCGKGNSLQCMSHSNTLKLKQLSMRKSYPDYYHFHHHSYNKQW